ncbi:DNA helicase, partial [Butyricicoccus sp. 1XD8-22]
AIRELESNIEQLKDNMEKTAQIQSKLDLKKEEEEQVNSQIQTGQNALNEMIEELKQLNATGIQLEKQFAEVEQITKQNPEAELEKTQKKSNELKKEIEALKEKIGLLPIAEVLHKEWKSLLEHSTEHDLEEIRKLYVKHANVIGTTCVASANKEFMDNYPIFDVVIIDEVSKATPPELLLPMLK